MTRDISAGFGDFGGRSWLNTAHQGALPLVAAGAAGEAVSWKTHPYELTTDRFQRVPQRLREALARLVNARTDDIVLANSASYSLHLIATAYPWREGDEVLVLAGDFPSDILPWLVAEQRYGVRVRQVRPRDRVVQPDELAAAITPRTRVFCTTWVHSFSGYLADLAGLGAVCREHGVTFVVNGSQAVGARPVDMSSLPVDALVSVGFKWLCGPYGTGFCWLRPSLRQRLRRTKAYWLSQFDQTDLARDDLEITLPSSVNPRGYDIFGTANFNNYVPWTAAVEHQLDVGADRIHRYDQELVDHLLAGLDDAGLQVLSPREPDRRSTLVYFSHADRARNADLHRRLADAGVDLAHRAGSLRVSAHLYNTTGDLDRLLAVLRPAV